MNTNIMPLAEPFELKGENAHDLLIILIHGFTASPTEVKPFLKMYINIYNNGSIHLNWKRWQHRSHQLSTI